jgi:hypothetical protein
MMRTGSAHEHKDSRDTLEDLTGGTHDEDR